MNFGLTHFSIANHFSYLKMFFAYKYVEIKYKELDQK